MLPPSRRSIWSILTVAAGLGAYALVDTPRAGVIRRGGKAEIAVFAIVIAQQARRGGNCLRRVERIVEPPVRGGLRHELRDAERAG